MCSLWDRQSCVSDVRTDRIVCPTADPHIVSLGSSSVLGAAVGGLSGPTLAHDQPDADDGCSDVRGQKGKPASEVVYQPEFSPELHRPGRKRSGGDRSRGKNVPV